jgi:2'-hydroxyisoflavone reductase
MMFDRRRFVFGSLAAGLAVACGSRKDPSVVPAPDPAQPVTPPKLAKKSILILGGTGFLGPHIVDAARARGHTITLFNRGKTKPGLYPDIEKLHGDRDGKLEALTGRKWDAVVDPSAYVPRIVKLSAELLAPHVKQYIFISTISVYKDLSIVNADESAPLNKLDDPTNEDVKKNYGALKALSEQAAEAAMPGRVANIRPGLIIGPGDPTGRFTHWPTRMAEGGEVLAPGDGSTPTQFIDGRDLGAWIVKLVETNSVGTYNALGPEKRLTMKEMLDAVNAATGNKATLTWVDADFLDKQGVGGWGDMPAWFDNKGEMAGFGTMKNERAVKAGLVFRPVRDSAKDTLDWLAAKDTLEWIETLPDGERAKVRGSGISRDREAKVLAAWKAR